MITDIIKDIDLSFILPNKEDIDNLVKKLENDEELDCFDKLTLSKISFCRYIIEREKKMLTK